MTPPELHSNDFTDRQSAPPMSAVSRGYRVTVQYHPSADDTHRTRTVKGDITMATYGKFEDVIEFVPYHTDNTWRLEIKDHGLELHYRWGDTDWRRLDEPQLETTASVESVIA